MIWRFDHNAIRLFDDLTVLIFSYHHSTMRLFFHITDRRFELPTTVPSFDYSTIRLSIYSTIWRFGRTIIQLLNEYDSTIRCCHSSKYWRFDVDDPNLPPIPPFDYSTNRCFDDSTIQLLFFSTIRLLEDFIIPPFPFDCSTIRLYHGQRVRNLRKT